VNIYSLRCGSWPRHLLTFRSFCLLVEARIKRIIASFLRYITEALQYFTRKRDKLLADFYTNFYIYDTHVESQTCQNLSEEDLEIKKSVKSILGKCQQKVKINMRYLLSSETWSIIFTPLPMIIAFFSNDEINPQCNRIYRLTNVDNCDSIRHATVNLLNRPYAHSITVWHRGHRISSSILA